MAKPSMIIDLVSKGPGEDEDEAPFDDEGESEDAPRRDPEALIASIERQLSELRRSVADL